jgi:hypothetical protein
MWEDSFLNIAFDRFGFSIDSGLLYLSISWELLLVSAVAFVAYKIIKRNKRVF